MPLQPKLNRFTTVSPININFDWIDVITGAGYVTYYANILSFNKVFNELLSPTPFITPHATGIINRSEFDDYVFKTSVFNTKARIRGTAYLGLHYDHTGTNETLSFSVTANSGEVTSLGIGAVEWSELGEVNVGDGDPNAAAEIASIDDYVNKVTIDAKVTASGGTPVIDIKYTYYDNSTILQNYIITRPNYSTHTHINPNPLKLVSKVNIITHTIGGVNVTIRNFEIYQELTNDTRTSRVVCPEITTNQMTVDTDLLLEMLCNNITINTKEWLQLNFIKGATPASIVVDAAESIQANKTLKLNLPFELSV